MGLVKKDDGWRIPDELWAKLEPLLPSRPTPPLGCHNPGVPDRFAWTPSSWCYLRTGMQWSALRATGLCHPSSAYRRFREWLAAGVFREFWRQGLLAYDGLVRIYWSWLALDGPWGRRHWGKRPQSNGPSENGHQQEPADSLVGRSPLPSRAVVPARATSS